MEREEMANDTRILKDRFLPHFLVLLLQARRKRKRLNKGRDGVLEEHNGLALYLQHMQRIKGQIQRKQKFFFKLKNLIILLKFGSLLSTHVEDKGPYGGVPPSFPNSTMSKFHSLYGEVGKGDLENNVQ